jgi:hypothetical protein
MAEPCGCYVKHAGGEDGVTPTTVYCPMHAEVDNLLAAATAFLAVVDESEGIEGWHLNGAIAPWSEFDFIEDLREAAARGGAA